MAAINVPGVIAIVLFYLLIVIVGIWAARRRKNSQEETMLAGRSIGLFIGTFTMTGNLNGSVSVVQHLLLNSLLLLKRRQRKRKKFTIWTREWIKERRSVRTHYFVMAKLKNLDVSKFHSHGRHALRGGPSVSSTTYQTLGGSHEKHNTAW